MAVQSFPPTILIARSMLSCKQDSICKENGIEKSVLTICDQLHLQKDFKTVHVCYKENIVKTLSSDWSDYELHSVSATAHVYVCAHSKHCNSIFVRLIHSCRKVD